MGPIQTIPTGRRGRTRELPPFDPGPLAGSHGPNLAPVPRRRMPFNAWLNWARCLALQASYKEWPTTHGGIESLGATLPRMRFRSLNTGRSLESASATSAPAAAPAAEADDAVRKLRQFGGSVSAERVGGAEDAPVFQVVAQLGEQRLAMRATGARTHGEAEREVAAKLLNSVFSVDY